MIQNSKFKIQNSRQGFTLIELLVTMAIVGILAATAIVNFGKNEDRDVRAEKDRLTSFLREVQNKALTAERAGLTPAGKICGFGINFVDASALQIFYVETKTTVLEDKLDVSCAGANVSKKYTSGTNSTASLFPNSTNPEKFIFKNFVTVNGTLPADIFFLAPNSEVYSDGSTTFSNPITINLIKGSITPIPAYIDQSGRIY